MIRMHWQALCSHMYSSCAILNLNTNLELWCNGTERENSKCLEKSCLIAMECLGIQPDYSW